MHKLVKKKHTIYSVGTALLILCVVIFFEKINGILTFSVTKELTLTESVTTQVGWLELLMKPLSIGLFSHYFSITSILAIFCVVSGLALLKGYEKKNTTLAPTISNNAKIWFIFITLYAILEIATSQFNMAVVARLFRFNFDGGASVPTSPWSLTDIGTMIEYHYMVSIKRFFNEQDWSVIEWGVYLTCFAWAAAKAHHLASRNVRSSESVGELFSQIPAAVIAVFVAAFAPYRLTGRDESEKARDLKDIAGTLKNLHFSDRTKEKAMESLRKNDSVIGMIQDRQGSHVHQIMDVVNPTKTKQ